MRGPLGRAPEFEEIDIESTWSHPGPVRMTDTAVAVTTKSASTKSTARPRVLFLVLGLAFVLGCRLLLYAWMPDRNSDFDQLYDAAARLVRGENPYPPGAQGLPYPLPAVLLAVPFTGTPLGLARPIFDVLVGWAFVYALWRYRGPYALLALVSGAYLFAMWHGQTTPLMVAASLIPVLGFLLAVRPNTAAALWIARPSWMAVVGVSVFVALSLAVRPSWPQEWWMALPPDTTQLMPPVLRPFGFVLLLAALRWRSPEGRLIFAMALIPQNTLPYELVSLALIPANWLEMGIYVAGTWIAVVAADQLHVSRSMAEWAATGWPVTLCAVYLPMLYLVVRRQSGWSGRRLDKDRRRAHRLPDDELEVDVTTDGAGGVIVKVTHLPTKRSATESGPTREAAERKAQDKLAAMLAGKSRLVRES
jgi:hypothetical protein